VGSEPENARSTAASLSVRASICLGHATLELSIEGLGHLMNALWQDFGYQEPRRGPLEEDLRHRCDALHL
jgi:hypothetical protein